MPLKSAAGCCRGPSFLTRKHPTLFPPFLLHLCGVIGTVVVVVVRVLALEIQGGPGVVWVRIPRAPAQHMGVGLQEFGDLSNKLDVGLASGACRGGNGGLGRAHPSAVWAHRQTLWLVPGMHAAPHIQRDPEH